MPSLPPLRTLLVGLVGGAVLGVGLYLTGLRAGQRETSLAYELRLAQQANIHIQQQSAVNAQNTVLQDRLAHLTEEQAHAQAQSDRLVSDLLGSLQARPARPPETADSGRSAATNGATGFGTGAQLYREDAEFLAREAARADQIRLALSACTTQYRTVIDALRVVGYVTLAPLP